MFKGTGQRAKFKWSTKVPPCPQARRYISPPLRLLGVLLFFFFPFSTSNISHLGSRGVFYTLQRSQLACLIHSFFSLFLTLKALNAVNFTSAGSFDCILLLWLSLSRNSLLFILDLLLLLRVIWDVIYGFQFLSGVFYITVSCNCILIWDWLLEFPLFKIYQNILCSLIFIEVCHCPWNLKWRYTICFQGQNFICSYLFMSLFIFWIFVQKTC